MPETVVQAKSHGLERAFWRHRAIFPVGIMCLYLALCAPMLALHRFDFGTFVVAGARWVDATRIQASLPVRAGSDGYDGQFYYRIAQHPLTFEATVGGITFDHPAKRAERLLYPLAGWLLSLGLPRFTALALFALNVAGLGAIAWLARDIAARLGQSALVPVAIVLWPGFLVTLTHDTAEIFSTAALLAALAALVRGRPALYALLAACAVLARETTLAMVAGVALAALPWRRLRSVSGWRRFAVSAAPLAPFLLWRQIVATQLHDSPQAQGMGQDIGWPLLGAARMLETCVTGAHRWASTPSKDMAERAIVLLTAVPLLAFCAVTAYRLRPALRTPSLTGFAGGWILTAALMSTLTANGPWIDPNAYLRAFSECFIIGMLLLGAADLQARPVWIGLAAGELLLSWVFCMAELR